MLVDWFTVAAQALNFLILLWLMKRFLYAPILRAIDAREQRIAAELKDAGLKSAEATRERDEFERKNEDFDRQRAELLSTATDEVNSQRQAMLDEARETVDSSAARRQDALRAQAEGLSRSVEDSARNEVFSITRSALRDLASAELEAGMAGVLMKRLRALDGQAKKDLAVALGTASTPPTVSSAFALPDKERGAIGRTLQEVFSSQTPPRFEIRTDLVCGIELSANGQIVAWNVDGYLESLRKEVGRIASEHGAQANAAESVPDSPRGRIEEEATGTDTDHGGNPADAVVPLAQVSIT